MSYYSILNRCFLNIKKLMLHKTAIVTFMFIALLFSWFAGQIVVDEKEIVSNDISNSPEVSGNP